jgi:hypothetical protein
VPQLLPDTSAMAVHHAVRVPDTRGRAAASGDLPAGPVLWELIAGSAAAGGMQPAPVDTSQPSGQPAAELATDIGHCRPGE